MGKADLGQACTGVKKPHHQFRKQALSRRTVHCNAPGSCAGTLRGTTVKKQGTCTPVRLEGHGIGHALAPHRHMRTGRRLSLMARAWHALLAASATAELHNGSAWALELAASKGLGSIRLPLTSACASSCARVRVRRCRCGVSSSALPHCLRRRRCGGPGSSQSGAPP